VCPPGQPARRTSSHRARLASRDCTNPAPLSPRQLQAFLGAVVRELLWGLPVASGELRKWRNRAAEIPDETIRLLALDALDRKRGNTHGAGMFWTLPRVRSLTLLRLLVTYQVLWDYLDSISEHDATTGKASTRQLHLALVDALDPGRPISDYYRHRPGHNDGGYLCTLVQACRECCLRLPSFQRVRPLLVREAAHVEIQAINHDPDAASREAALHEWVAHEFPPGQDVQWFELAAAAGANIAIYALLALAAESACDEGEIARVYRAYFPWAGALATMLDSYVDEIEDLTAGEQRYVAYYPSSELATRRMVQLLRRCLYEVGDLRNSKRHTLLMGCMVAMYLSKDSARTRDTRDTTKRLINAGGSLTKILRPILRAWRIANRQRSA
jgi:tetraprenyl-beta-curcumene synthase